MLKSLPACICHQSPASKLELNGIELWYEWKKKKKKIKTTLPIPLNIGLCELNGPHRRLYSWALLYMWLSSTTFKRQATCVLFRALCLLRCRIEKLKILKLALGHKIMMIKTLFVAKDATLSFQDIFLAQVQRLLNVRREMPLVFCSHFDHKRPVTGRKCLIPQVRFATSP